MGISDMFKTKEDYTKIITKARDEGYKQAKAEYDEIIQKMREQKEKEFAILTGEKDALVSRLKNKINQMEDVVDNANNLSMAAIKYVTDVKALVSEKTGQSNMFIELASRTHQMSLQLEQKLQQLSDRTQKEIETQRKLLEYKI